jgi:hypothetical protein
MFALKKITLLCAIVFSYTQIGFSQMFSSDEIVIAPSVSIDIEGKKSTIREGERLTLKAKGGDDQSLLQWQVSMDNKNWQDIPKATGNIFETTSLTHNSYFRLVSRPIDTAANITKVETSSNVQLITLESNVASTKR